MSRQLKSGDFLENLDIEVSFRSGQTDLVSLLPQNVIETSFEKMLDTEIVLTEFEASFKSNSEGNLWKLKCRLQIK